MAGATTELVLPSFSHSSVVHVFVLGIILAVNAVLLFLVLFTAPYHYPLSRLNYVLQAVSVSVLLLNVSVSAGTTLRYLYRIGVVWPHAFPFVGLELPPTDRRWSVAERALFLLLQAFTTMTAHLTNVQYLTMLFPSRLEGRMIIWLLAPLGLIQSGFSFAYLAPTTDVKVRDLGVSIMTICQSSLGLLYTAALVVWGALVNRHRAWFMDGGTAWFGSLALVMASAYTVMSFVYIAYNRLWWINWVCWTLIVWQSWVGFWWWVSAGMGIGEVEDRQRREERRRQRERRRARREHTDAAAAAAAPNDIPLTPLAPASTSAPTSTSSDTEWPTRVGRFVARRQPRAVRDRLGRLKRAHDAAIRRAAEQQAATYARVAAAFAPGRTEKPESESEPAAEPEPALAAAQRAPRVRLARMRRQDRTTY